MSKINKVWISIVFLGYSLCFACGCRHSECREFLELPTDQRHMEFGRYTPEKQLDVYLCAMKAQPPYSSLANQIADRGESSVPLILKRMQEVKSEKEQYDLIYLLEVISERGTLRGRKDVVAEISQVVDRMQFDVLRQRGLESLKKIEINSGIKPFTYVR
ncbi:MAG TPA: hypothetical protein VGW76_05840 [Pyrinomonadaceae bacterium]|nr:hypothetical protein [Pyrinomonadaceae bacterium]